MVVGSLVKWLGLALVGMFAITSIVDPQRAYGSTQVFGNVGTALGNLGRGVQSLLTGVGTGSAQLLNPLWTLRDLIYGSNAGVQIGNDVRQSVTTNNLSAQQIPSQQSAIQLDPNAAFTPMRTWRYDDPATFASPPNYSVVGAEQGAAAAANQVVTGYSYHSRPSISPSPVAQATVHGQSLPLSQAAISHYQSIGVSVSPASSQTVASQNSSNATSNSSASSNYRAGAAQAAGYSTGRPR